MIPRRFAILERIVAGPDSAARKAAIAELTEIAPRTIDAIGEWLARERKTELADRRAVLTEIKASVPDRAGGSRSPRVRAARSRRPTTISTGRPSCSRSIPPRCRPPARWIADDVAIRALAATRDFHAAQVVFDVAFAADTMIYRDELRGATCAGWSRHRSPR